jgi:four helix bundle protein
MGSFERFEDIEAWKKARDLVAEVYRATKNTAFRRDFALSDQIKRATISVMLNIAEGSARRTDREFSQYLFIAIGSIAEIQSALYIALDQEYIDKVEFDKIYNQAAEIGRMLSGLLKYLRSGGR